MGPCLRTVKSLRLRVGGEIHTGDTVVGVRSSPPEQDRGDEIFRQLEEASCLQILVLRGDLNHPVICWKNNTAGLREARWFLERTEDGSQHRRHPAGPVTYKWGRTGQGCEGHEQPWLQWP